MKFLDQCKIFVKSGDGGAGCVGFRREKFIEFGGPDGGDGGRGGDVIFEADRGLSTLLDPSLRPLVRAEDGVPGGSNGRDGKSGADFLLRLPVGPVGREAGTPDDAAPLFDLVEHGQRFS